MAKRDPRQRDFLLEEDDALKQLADRMLKRLQKKESKKTPKFSDRRSANR